LASRHHNKYLTVNISGRPIDETVLRNVISFQWEDHKAPPFDTLFLICDEVAHFLAQDSERVAVFHCNHGKGRTGTIICCFFLFMGIFSDYKEVMEFYGKRRFEKEGYGVTQPCQIQYIRYFQQYLNNHNHYPQVLNIKKLTFKGGFSFTDPYIKLINMTTGEVIYSTKEIENALHIEKDKQHAIVFTQKHWFAGDVTLELKEYKPIGRNLLISYVFNTAFVRCEKEDSETYRPTLVKLQEMSPLGKQKQRNFEKDFEVDIEFRKHCECGEMRRVEGCSRCKGILGGEFAKWERIRSALRVLTPLFRTGSCCCRGITRCVSGVRNTRRSELIVPYPFPITYIHIMSSENNEDSMDFSVIDRPQDAHPPLDFSLQELLEQQPTQ
jgi:phosphatidylinositol-3,4,5-trisphosphate 3-phosphatase/dual-specificity protein phosphatase PTEN